MDIFSVITLFGGLAFFLYGMHLLSSSLEKMVGGKLERILRSMTSNRFKALLLGMGITIAIQSSSAMTVMLVGLVNSGIMELGQTIGVIMGSNIGTTVTAWILSLSGITSDNVFVQLLKPESFSPIVALIGIILNPLLILTANATVLLSLLWIIAPLPLLQGPFSAAIGAAAGLQNAVVGLAAEKSWASFPLRLEAWQVIALYAAVLAACLLLRGRKTKHNEPSLSETI